jgi:hypothetical protein
MSREEFILETIMLESTVRDIVSRLTALDDDGRNVRSFHSVFAAMKREGLDPERTKALDRKVKAYRSLANALKVTHRNAYIAHVAELAAVKPRILDEPLDFSAVAAAAVNLMDAFVGQEVAYLFKIGSREPHIDLRRALAG